MSEDAKDRRKPESASVAHQTSTDGVRVEIEREAGEPLASLALAKDVDLLAGIRNAIGLSADAFLFERDKDEPLDQPDRARKTWRLVAHSARLITVKVRYEHRSIEEKFAPARTVFRVLQWAVGKKGFNLDPTIAAKANLILPGAEAPMPREAAIGTFVRRGEHVLVVDLTLRDFTNG